VSQLEVLTLVVEFHDQDETLNRPRTQ
jgi:hypothetical protein